MISPLAFKNNSEDSYILPREKVPGGASGLVAILASQIATNASAPITLATILPAMKKAGEYDSLIINDIQDGAKKVLKESGLEKKGVKIKFIKKTEGKITFKDLMNPISMVQKGINAFFIPQDAGLLKKNTILIPEKDISYALYHELGHAYNFNMSKFGKILQQCRPLSMYAPAFIALYGAFSRKSKPENGKKLTIGQKTNNFIRDNAGKLSLVLTLPMLIEEGMATKKGLGWAKNYLSSDNFKLVKKGNLIAYTSYLLTAASLSFASWIAVKVKDKLIAKREKAQEELYREAGVI